MGCSCGRLSGEGRPSSEEALLSPVWTQREGRWDWSAPSAALAAGWERVASPGHRHSPAHSLAESPCSRATPASCWALSVALCQLLLPAKQDPCPREADSAFGRVDRLDGGRDGCSACRISAGDPQKQPPGRAGSPGRLLGSGLPGHVDGGRRRRGPSTEEGRRERAGGGDGCAGGGGPGRDPEGAVKWSQLTLTLVAGQGVRSWACGSWEATETLPGRGPGAVAQRCGGLRAEDTPTPPGSRTC